MYKHCTEQIHSNHNKDGCSIASYAKARDVSLNSDVYAGCTFMHGFYYPHIELVGKGRTVIFLTIYIHD